MASPVWLCPIHWTCRTCSLNYSSVSHQQRLDASSNTPIGEEDHPTAPTDQNPPTCERGDASAHGFWQHGCTNIIDVRIMDTQSCSYRNKDYQKVGSVETMTLHYIVEAKEPFKLHHSTSMPYIHKVFEHLQLL